METIVRMTTGILAGFCVGQSLFKLFSRQPRHWKRIPLYLLLTASIIVPSWVGDENPILLFPFFILGFLLLLPGDKLPKLIVGGIFYTLLIPINMLLDSLYWDNISLVLAQMGKSAVWCTLAFFLVRLAPKEGLRLSKKLWLLLGGLTLAPLMAVLSFSIWGNNFQAETEYQFYFAVLQRFSFTILPFVMVSALTLLLAAVVLSRHEALEQENRLAALREVYYTGLKQEQTGLRTLRHDLHNHITALQGLLEQDKQEALSSYLASLAGSPAMEGGKRYAKNETANIVLASKANLMETLGLTPNFSVALPEDLTLSDIDLCALLGNALDNAIAGVAGADDKTITLRAQLNKGLFVLEVENTIGSTVKPDLSTTKKDAAQHGYGLIGMKEIAVRHGGSLEALPKDGRFALLVFFPCEAR